MKRELDGDPEALAKVLAAVPEVVLVVDREGTIHYVNHVEEGYERDAVIGTQADAFMSPESKAVFWATLETVLRTAEAKEYESKVLAPGGGMQWYRSRMVPMREDGEAIGVIVMATNISEIKAAQEAADQLRRLLPICSWCNKIRTEEGVWETVEAYLGKVQHTKVSHGMCLQCAREHLHGMEDGGDSNGHIA